MLNTNELNADGFKKGVILRLPANLKYSFQTYCQVRRVSMNSVLTELVKEEVTKFEKSK